MKLFIVSFISGAFWTESDNRRKIGRVHEYLKALKKLKMWILQSKLLSSNKIISTPSKCGIHAFTETFPFTLKIHFNIFLQKQIHNFVSDPISWDLLTYVPPIDFLTRKFMFFWEFLRMSEKYHKERRKHGIQDSAREIDFYRQFRFCLQTHES